MLKITSSVLHHHLRKKVIASLSMGLLLISLLPAAAFGTTTTAITATDPLQSITAAIATTSTVLNIENGNSVASPAIITITLTNGNWTLTSSVQINSLISGLTETPNSTAWALVQTALKKGNSTTGTGNNYFNQTGNILTITIPAVPNYSPLTDQSLSLTIPTTLLPSGQSAITSNSSNITLPDFSQGKKESLEKSISDNVFANAFVNNSLNQIYFIVPTIYLKSVSNTPALISGVFVNSMNIYTDSSVTAVKVNGVAGVTTTGGVTTTDTTDGKDYISSIPLKDANGKTFFNVGFTSSRSSFNANITLTYPSSTPTLVPIIFAGTKSNYGSITTDLTGSYSLYFLINNPSILTSILKSYTTSDITLTTVK